MSYTWNNRSYTSHWLISHNHMRSAMTATGTTATSVLEERIATIGPKESVEPLDQRKSWRLSGGYRATRPMDTLECSQIFLRPPLRPIVCLLLKSTAQVDHIFSPSAVTLGLVGASPFFFSSALLLILGSTGSSRRGFYALSCFLVGAPTTATHTPSLGFLANCPRGTLVWAVGFSCRLQKVFYSAPSSPMPDAVTCCH